MRYYRRGWPHAQSRFFQSLPLAYRLVRRLQGQERGELRPLEWITVERRPVGAWQLYEVTDEQ